MRAFNEMAELKQSQERLVYVTRSKAGRLWPRRWRTAEEPLTPIRLTMEEICGASIRPVATASGGCADRGDEVQSLNGGCAFSGLFCRAARLAQDHRILIRCSKSG